MPSPVLLTCEHGGHDVPPEFACLFHGSEEILSSHRGWDPGALHLARYLGRHLAAPVVSSTVTRLLVELNRSPSHPNFFSEFSRRLSGDVRKELLDRYYRPHIDRVRSTLESLMVHGRTVHIGVHTFTPVLAGVIRHCDVGLLYDPRRAAERQFCQAWQQALREVAPALRVRRNFPYRGDADGLTTIFRRNFDQQQYLGIELEVSQEWPLRRPDEWPRLCEHLVTALRLATTSSM